MHDACGIAYYKPMAANILQIVLGNGVDGDVNGSETVGRRLQVAAAGPGGAPTEYQTPPGRPRPPPPAPSSSARQQERIASKKQTKVYQQYNKVQQIWPTQFMLSDL